MERTSFASENHCIRVRLVWSALSWTQMDPRPVTFSKIQPVLHWPGSHWPGPFCAQFSHWSAQEKQRPASHPKPATHSAQPSTPAPVHRLHAVAHASQLRSGVSPKPSRQTSQPKLKSQTSHPSTLHLEHSEAPQRPVVQSLNCIVNDHATSRKPWICNLNTKVSNKGKALISLIF